MPSSCTIFGTLPSLEGVKACWAEAAPGKGDVVVAFRESRLAGLGEAFPDAEAMPFAKWVTRCAALAKVPVRPLLQEGHSLAVARRFALGRSDDSILAGVKDLPSVHHRLAILAAELESFGLDADALATLSQKPDAPGRLGSWLGEIGQLMAQLEHTTGALGREFLSQRIRRVLEADIPPETRFPRTFLWIGEDAGPQWAEMVQWATERTEVFLAVDRHPADVPLFFEAERFVLRIGGEAISAPKGDAFASALFGEAASERADLTVRTFYAADPLAEAEWALREALWVLNRKPDPANKRIEPKAIAIVARDLDTYGPLIEASAIRLGTPVALTRVEFAGRNRFVREILGWLGLFAGDLAGLADVVGGSALPFSTEVRAEFELKLREAASSGGWEAVRSWVASLESPVPWLSAWLDFESNLTEVTLSEWCHRLNVALSDENVQTGWLDGDEDRRVWATLFEALQASAAVATVWAEPAIGFDKIIFQISQLAKQVEVASTPNPNGIPVVRDPGALVAPLAVLSVGMLEGQFPRRRAEDPLLRDDERAWISHAMGWELPIRDSRDRARGERDDFYRLAISPSDTLILSFPLTDENRDNVPTFYLDAIRAASGKKVPLEARARDQHTPPASRAVARADKALLEALSAEPLPTPSMALRTEAALKLVRASDEDALSPGEARDALACEFRYAFRRRLGVFGPTLTEIWRRFTEVFDRVNLAECSTAADATEALSGALEQYVREVSTEASPDEVEVLVAGARRQIREFVAREYQARQLWPRQLLATKPRLGSTALSGEIQLDGQSVALRGRAEALSKLGPYRLLTLLGRRFGAEKSGDLSPDDHLELGLWMKAMIPGGGIPVVETDSPGGSRRLFVLERQAEPPLNSRQQEGLRVVELDGDRFLRETEHLLRQALQTTRSGVSRPCPGDVCARCRLGEICRRSSEFGENEDPFAGDGNGD